MLIDIVEVTKDEKTNAQGRTYSQLTVLYKYNGQISEKKLMSFSNPAVFKAIEGLSKGDQIDVTSVKNEKTGYRDWTAVNQGGSQPATASSTPAAATRVTGSNYETKEERQVKQRYIVRQSSLTNAINSLSIGAKSALSASDVISLAKQYEEFVFSETTKPALDAIVEDLADDLPY